MIDTNRERRQRRMGMLGAIACAAALAVTTSSCGDDAAREAAPSAKPDTTAASSGVAIDSQTVSLTMQEPIVKYNVESGVVEYTNSRLGRRQIFYFANGGADEAIYLEGGGADSVGVPFDVSIYTGTWRFDYNERERTGIAKQQPNAPGPVLGMLPDLRSVRITPLEPRTIAGQRASGIAFDDTRAWMWKGIPLRVERPVRGGDTLVIEAVSIRPGEKIPPERFQVPDDVKLSRLK